MMWPLVVSKMVELLRGDAQLQTLLGGQDIYKSRARLSIQVPGIYWTVVSDTVGENNGITIIQWDIFGDSVDTIQQIEGRMYALMHSADHTLQLSGGVQMQGQYYNGYDGADHEQGVLQRSVEYRYTTVRSELGSW